MEERYTAEELAAFAVSARASAEQFAPEVQHMILEYHESPDAFISFAFRQFDPSSLCCWFANVVQRGEKYQRFLLLRLGLLDGRRQTLDELAALLGISRERARQVQHVCLDFGCCIHRRKQPRDYLND